jgi:hypothetical protein
MRKKAYTKPAIDIFSLQNRNLLLSSSLDHVNTKGNGGDVDLEYDSSGGSQGNAW